MPMSWSAISLRWWLSRQTAKIRQDLDGVLGLQRTPMTALELGNISFFEDEEAVQ